MTDLKPDSIHVENDREKVVLEELLSFPSNILAPEAAERTAEFIQSHDDPVLPYNAFEVAVKVVKSLPHEDILAHALVEVFRILKDKGLVSKKDIDTWTRDAWNCGPADPGWEDLNVFACRLMCAGFDDLSTYGIWALENALERKPPEKQSVGAAWWIRGSRVLHNQIGNVTVKTGPSLEGRATLDKEMWGLWEERMCQLLSKETSQESLCIVQ